MEVIDEKQNRLPFYSSISGDMAVSHRDYYQIIDVLLDERLSPRMLMKFKNLYEVNSYGMFSLGVAALPIGYAFTRFVQGPVNRGIAQKRTVWPNWAFFTLLSIYYLSGVPVERKLYTDILADKSLDGEYVRRTIRARKPAIWRKISKQLYQKGFNLPEMHEFKSATEFPMDFVSSRVI